MWDSVFLFLTSCPGGSRVLPSELRPFQMRSKNCTWSGQIFILDRVSSPCLFWWKSKNKPARLSGTGANGGNLKRSLDSSDIWLETLGTLTVSENINLWEKTLQKQPAPNPYYLYGRVRGGFQLFSTNPFPDNVIESPKECPTFVQLTSLL